MPTLKQKQLPWPGWGWKTWGSGPWGQQTPVFPKSGVNSVLSPHSLCTRITASRERMALRLGFCFQPSSERGSTYRRKRASTASLAGTHRPRSPRPQGPRFPGPDRHVLLALPGAGDIDPEKRYPLCSPQSRPGHPPLPIYKPPGRCPICLLPGVLLGKLDCLPHRCMDQGRAPHLVAQKSRHTGLGGITDGCEVMATLQGQHHCTSGQTHELLSHVPKT